LYNVLNVAVPRRVELAEIATGRAESRYGFEGEVALGGFVVDTGGCVEVVGDGVLDDEELEFEGDVKDVVRHGHRCVYTVVGLV